MFPSLRPTLFEANGRPGYSDARVGTQQVKATILRSAEFKSYERRVAAIFDAWRNTHEQLLLGIAVNALPKTVIRTLSEDLLARFADLPLLDRYDVYQRLMDYWDAVMQDDVYLIAAAGWAEAAKPRGIIEDKEKKIKETADLTIKRKKYKMDLIPPALIVARWFAVEQAAIEKLQGAQETAARELEEFVEEHSSSGGGEDGLLADAANDRGRVTSAAVKQRLKTIRGEPENDEERAILTRCLALIEAESRPGRPSREPPRPLWTARCWLVTPRSPSPRSRRWWSRTSVRQHPGRHRRRGATADPAAHPARAGVGATYARPLRRWSRRWRCSAPRSEAFEANGAVAMSQEFDFEHLVRVVPACASGNAGAGRPAVDRSLVERNWLFGRYVV